MLKISFSTQYFYTPHIRPELEGVNADWLDTCSVIEGTVHVYY